MEDIEKEIAEYLKGYSKYYFKMHRSIDFISSLEEKLVDPNAMLHPDIQKIYSEIPEGISSSDLRKSNVVYFRDAIIEPFLKSLDESAQQILGNVWVGILPIRSPNALCRYVPNTITPVVIVYEKMFAALSFRAESLFVYGKFLEYDEKLAGNFLVYYMQKLVDFFAGKNGLPIYELPQDVKWRSVQIASAQEVFLMAHEFAHIYLNHLDLAKVTTLHLEESGIDFDFFSFEQKLEFEADLLASKWIINFQNKNVDKDSLIYANIFSLRLEIFSLLYLIQENIVDNTETKNKSHPSADVRVQYIYSKLKNDLSDFDRKSIEEMLERFKHDYHFSPVKITPELDKEVHMLIKMFVA